uniref:Neurocan n=1 Tax=Malurus cyaneus samueli TaxID=2593467 RepID=A0A8C5TLB8_9PASS
GRALSHFILQFCSSGGLRAVIHIRRVQHQAVRVGLGEPVTLPCLFLLHPSAALGPNEPPEPPRVKWSKVRSASGQREDVPILVAKDNAVKVVKAYEGRVSLPGYPRDRSNATLQLRAARASDAGLYRCEVVARHIDDGSRDLLPRRCGEPARASSAGAMPLPGRWTAQAGGVRRPGSGSHVPVSHWHPGCPHVPGAHGSGVPVSRAHRLFLGVPTFPVPTLRCPNVARRPTASGPPPATLLHVPVPTLGVPMFPVPTRSWCPHVPCPRLRVPCPCPRSPGDPHVPVPTAPVSPCPGAHGSAVPADIDDCLSSPCQNGGTCTPTEVNSFVCLCLPSYGGSRCEKGAERPRAVTTTWHKFQGHCYRYFARRRSWEDAERDCRPAGRRPFTSIHSQEEHSFINGFGHENTWIGLNDRIVEQDFQWTDNSGLAYENWREEPTRTNFFAGGEDCVVLVFPRDRKWNDVPAATTTALHLGVTGLCVPPVLCGPPPEVPNAFPVGKKKEKYNIHSSVRYQCQEGFTQRHVPTIKCHSTGKWDRPKILCYKT